MKRKLLKIMSYIVPSVVMLFVCTAPIGGASFATIRAGEEYVIKNEYTDKTVNIIVDEEVSLIMPVGICLRGDANSDENVDVFDAITVAKYTVGTLDIKGFEGSIGEFAGNVNMSSDLDVFDAVAIARFTVSGESNPDTAWDKIL